MSLRSALVCALAALAACSGEPKDERIAPLLTANLEAGVGFQNARIGGTTLGQFFDRFGAERTDVIVSDRTGFEIVFGGGQLAFLFLFEDVRLSDEETSAMRRATRDLGAYLQQWPTSQELPLASISVATNRSGDSALFRGKLDGQVALLDPISKAMLAYGVPGDGLSPMMAGMSPDLPDGELYYPDDGVIIFHEPAKSGEGAGDLPVRRITVFAPVEEDS